MATNGSFICMAGLGRHRYYVSLPAANDALVLAFLQPTGQQDDDALRDNLTFAALFATSTGNKECTAPGYARQLITSGTSETPDYVNNRVDSTVPTRLFPGLGAMTGTNAKQDQAALLLGYQPDTTSGSDATIQLIGKAYYPFVADGTDRQVTFPSNLLRAAG